MSDTLKHTPGPFEVQNPMGDDVGLWIVQAGLEAYEWSTIAIVCRDEDRNGKHFITKAEQKANAALFAAAPEMRAALEQCQKALAMMIAPDAIRQTTTINAFEQCTSAELAARKALGKDVA